MGEGSPTKIDYRKGQKRKHGTLILTSLLEDLVLDLEAISGLGPAEMKTKGPRLFLARLVEGIFEACDSLPGNRRDGHVSALRVEKAFGRKSAVRRRLHGIITPPPLEGGTGRILTDCSQTIKVPTFPQHPPPAPVGCKNFGH